MSKREKEIEQYLVKETKKRKGLALKWVSPGYAGVPDRLIFLPGGKFAMAELKREGEKPRPLQLSRHRLFEKLGFKVYVVDSEDGARKMLDEIEGGCKR